MKINLYKLFEGMKLSIPSLILFVSLAIFIMQFVIFSTRESQPEFLSYAEYLILFLLIYIIITMVGTAFTENKEKE